MTVAGRRYVSNNMFTRSASVVACLVFIGACTQRYADLDMIEVTVIGGCGSSGGTSGGTTGGSDSRSSTAVATCGDGDLDAGKVCDDGNLEDGDGCRPDCTVGSGAALPPVWSSDYPASAFAMAGGVLVVGSDERVQLASLTPDGPAPWCSRCLESGSFDLALAPDGDIIVASKETLEPSLVWLHRIASTGALLWSRDLPGR